MILVFGFDDRCYLTNLALFPIFVSHYFVKAASGESANGA